MLNRNHFRSVLILVAAGLLAGCGGGGSDTGRPNIVLISLDCMRPDRLAAYGGPVNVAPTLNGLAAKATVFRNAYTAIGTTFPSHATMLTGLYPRMHGVRSNRYSLAEAFRTVPEILRENGYRTGAFVSFRQMVVDGGLGQGFDTRSDTEQSQISRERDGLFDDDGIFRDGADTTRLAIDWLSAAAVGEPRSPLLLWVHYYEPHAPYRLNDWSRARLGNYDGPLAQGVSIEQVRGEAKHLAKESDRHRRALETLYDGEVHKMDGHIDELMQALREDGLLENTVVIVVSDHGQGLGEHGFFGHGPSVSEEVLKIPFFIADMRQPVQRQVDALVGTVDIGPTMLSLAGVGPGAGWQGRDISAALRGQALEPMPYFSEVEFKEGNSEGWYHPDQIAVYDGGYKLTYNPESFQLFDLQTDPMADSPLHPARQPTVVDYMTGLAEDYLSRETRPHRADLSEQDLETLKSLGYIQ